MAASCCWLGCSRHPGRPETYPVTGKVTYKEQPVAGASVAFLAPGAPTFAVGKTDDAGNFTLTTFEPDDGAVAGNHVVTVKKHSDEAAAAAAQTGAAAAGGEVDSAAIEQAMRQQANLIQKAERAGSLLPQKYANQNTTDLRFDVVDAENFFEIKLAD